MYEGFRIAVGALRANKTRAILTTLGIVIGVVTVTFMLMIIQGLNKSFARQLSILGSGTVFIERFPWIIMDDWWRYRNRPRLEYKDFEAVQENSKLAEYVGAHVYTERPIAFKDRGMDRVGIVGITPDYGLVRNFLPEFGRGITDLDNDNARRVCLIGSELREKIFAPYNPIGQKLRVGAFAYTVVGILEEKGSTFGESNDNFVLLPFKTFTNTFGKRRNVAIAVKALDPGNIDALKDELTGIMRRSRGLKPKEENNFAINTQDLLTGFYERMTTGIYAAGLIIGGISLLVGGIGIMNIMLVSVTERTWEIGMRKAVGARTTNILWQFLVEAMLICTFGGVIGLGLAAAGGEAIKAQLPVSLPVWLGAGSILFSASVGLLFGLLPAWRASRLDPITALRQD